MFEGYWKDDNRHGFGKEYYNKFNPRIKYIGYWKENLKCGEGALYHENGKLCTRGFFEKDKVSETKHSLIFHIKCKIEKVPLRL